MKIWMRVDAHMHQNAKIVEAGLDAWAVFNVLLGINRAGDRNGQLGARESSPRYIATQLAGFEFDEDRASTALRRCASAGLVKPNVNGLEICGWRDGTWKEPLSGAERQARHRARKRQGQQAGNGQGDDAQ